MKTRENGYPGPGVVLDCIDSLSLPSFLLRLDTIRMGGGGYVQYYLNVSCLLF